MKFGVAKSFEKALKKFLKDGGNSFIQIQTTLLKIGSCSSSIGLNYEKISEYYYSFRVNNDIRIIAVSTNDNIILVYVDYHDNAYKWAKRNKPIINEINGYVGYYDSEVNLDTECSEKYDFLYNYGFDETFIKSLNCSNEDNIRKIIEHLSAEYQELILNINEKHRIIDNYVADIAIINNDLELKKALMFSFEEWRYFLHPVQKDIIEYNFDENILIKGGPGTGKTVILAWRYVLCKRKNPKTCIYVNFPTSKRVIERLIYSIDDTIRAVFIPDIKYCVDYTHLIIDEGQDLKYYEIKFLKNLLNDDKCPYFSISYDFNQRLREIIKQRDFRELNENSISFYLTYCYRSSNQVMEYALKNFTNMFRQVNNKALIRGVNADKDTIQMAYPLQGQEPIEINYSFDFFVKNYYEIIDEIIKKYNINVSSNDWVIIAHGSFEKTFIMKIKEEFGHTISSRHCKGLEYKTGIVLRYECENYKNAINNSFLQKVYSRSLDYVVHTRFREMYIKIILI